MKWKTISQQNTAKCIFSLLFVLLCYEIIAPLIPIKDFIVLLLLCDDSSLCQRKRWGRWSKEKRSCDIMRKIDCSFWISCFNWMKPHMAQYENDKNLPFLTHFRNYHTTENPVNWCGYHDMDLMQRHTNHDIYRMPELCFTPRLPCGAVYRLSHENHTATPFLVKWFLWPAHIIPTYNDWSHCRLLDEKKPFVSGFSTAFATT